MVDLKSIRVFLTVADQQGFAAAATALQLAPASVTRIVAQLEADLGQQLLARTTRQVGLTAAGALVAARFRPILASFDGAVSELLEDGRPDQGALRISAPVSLGLQVIPDMIEAFRAAYPDVSIEINFTDTLVDVIADACDLAIRVSGPPRDQSTIWRKLCEVPRCAVASPAFLNEIGPVNSPNDLHPDWMMSYSASPAPELWEFVSAGTKRSRRAGNRVVTNNGDFLLALAKRGEGVAVLPDFITRPALATEEIVHVLPDWSVPSLWLTLAYPPYTKLPPLVGLFAEHFEAFIQERTKDGTFLAKSASN